MTHRRADPVRRISAAHLGEFKPVRVAGAGRGWTNASAGSCVI